MKCSRLTDVLRRVVELLYMQIFYDVSKKYDASELLYIMFCYIITMEVPSELLPRT